MSFSWSVRSGRMTRQAVGVLAPAVLAAVLATCQVDELVSPRPPGALVASPDTARDSAAVGSRPVRVRKITLTSTGPGSIAWTATRARGSSWLALSATAGSTPDTLTLSLDPTGLFVGDYHDTVRITPADGSADPLEVPVTFAVQPCREQTLALGASVTDSLVGADCEAPHRADRFAKVYRFAAAAAGDSVSVVLRSTAFDPYVLVDSVTAGGVPPLAEADRCGADVAEACVRYVLLPRVGEFYVEVTSAGTGTATGAFTLDIQAPRPPAAPTGLAQLAADSITPVAVGGTINGSAFVIRATGSDPDGADSLAIDVEVRPVGTPFTGTPTALGALGLPGINAVRADGLADDTTYRWQARVRDQTGRASAWASFGGNPDNAADLRVAESQRPAVPTGLGQFRSEGSAAISSGAATPEATVVFKGTVADPDPGDQVRLEVEVQPFGAPFANAATAAGVLVPSGTEASVTVTGLADGVAYHWHVRTVDQAARASDWVAFAASGQVTEDFRVILPPTDLAFVTQPSGITAGSVIAPAVTVEVRKASGTIDGSYTGQVNVVLAPGAGTTGAVLGGTLSVSATAGVATFANLSVNLAGTGYRLLASAVGLNPATSDPFNVSASSATKLALTTAPSALARSGIRLAPQPVIRLQDASGNPVSQSGVQVTATIASGPAGASVSANAVLTDASGTAAFADLAVTGPTGNYTLRFDAVGMTGVVSGTIGLSPGTADPARTTATVPGGVAGSATPIVVTVRDGAGNRLTSGGELVTVTVTGANSASPTVTDNGDGTYSASYTPTVAGSDAVAIRLNGTAISGSPYASTVTAAGGAGLAFIAGPSNVLAGASISPPVQVAVRDANGNTVTSSSAAVTIAIGTNPGGGTLTGSLTVNAVAGVATFSNLSINKVGSGYTLTASATGLTGAASAAFNVTPGAATRLAFTGQPTNTVAGSTILPPVVVTVQDANGNTVTTSSASITVGIGTNPTGGLLDGTKTVSAVNGVASFGNLSIDKAGTGYTLSATSGGLASAVSSTFDVQVGSGNRLAFVVQPPMSGVAGTALSPAVQVAVQDQNGNTVTSSTATIKLALGANPGGGTLSGTTEVNAVNGVATFGSLSLNKTGSGYTLVATSTGLTGATSGAFNITPAGATKVAFTVQPTNVVAGAGISPAVAVAVRDAFDNTVTSSTAAVTVAIGTNPGAGALTGATTVTAVNGVAALSPLSIDKSGTGYTLTAASTGLTGATSNGFNVTAGTAAKLGFVVQPSTVVAGADITPGVQVAVQDASGNTVLSSTASISLSIGTNPGSGTLSGITTVSAINGVATFGDLGINRTGTGYTLTAAGTGLTGATSAAFNVTPGDPAVLAFAVQPSNTVAGQAIAPPIRVAVLDGLGNTVTSSTAGVTVAIGTNPAGGTLSGTATSNAVNGVATFGDLSINAAGSGYTLTAASAPLTGATSSAFNIEVGSGNKLAFVVQPSAAVVGAAVSPAIQVAVQDAANNVVTTATDAVTLILSENPGAATLGGTTTVNAVNGVATFTNVSLNRAAPGYTLRVLGSGLVGATSTAFNVTAAATTTAITSDLPDPSVTGQAVTVVYGVTVTAPGSGTPTGSVTVSDGGGATCVAPVAAGGCALTLTAAGSRTVTATYAGDGNFQGSTSPGVGHTVNPAATTTVITADLPDPSVTGEPVTVSYAVNVSSPGGGTPTGIVTVSAGTDTCVGSPAAASCELTFTTAGAKSITATYGGDANYLASPTSAAGAHQVNQAATTTELTSDVPDPSVVGQAVTVSVAVTPASPGAGTPGGSVAVSGGTGIDCVATLASGSGSCALVFPTSGAKSITATYAGDANYLGSASGAAAHQVNLAPTVTTIAADVPDPSSVGQAYTVSFTVTSTGGIPTGNVTVSDGTGVSCVGALAAGGGSCDLTSVTAGSKTLTASYAGDLNFASSPSLGVLHEVTPASTSTAVGSSVTPSVFGQEVTFTATVTSGVGTPAGSVQFVVDGTNYGAPVALSGGTASTSTTALAVATHLVVANYLPANGNFAASSGSLVGGQVVNQAATTTTITADTPDPSTVGQAVTVAYSVAVTAPGAGTPSGNVLVSDGAGTSCIGTAVAGSCALTFATAGAKTLTATYQGDPSFLASPASAPVDHQVDPAGTSTAVSSSVNPSVFGQGVTFTATVAGTGGTPTGTVQFAVDDVAFGDPVVLVAGVGTSPTTTLLAVGTHAVTASYAPADGNFTASAGTLAGGQVVNLAITTTTITSDAPDPSTAGVAVTVAYSVTTNAPGSGTPTGNVTVTSDGTASCVGTVADGSCVLTLTTAGARTLTATYAGDGSFASSSDTEAHQVGAAVTVTTVASSQNPSTLGQSVTFTATVTSAAGIPTGTVRFRVDGNDIPPAPFSKALANGVATSNPISSLTLGTHAVTATYTSNDANFATSVGTLDGGQVVNPIPTTTTVSSSGNPSVFGQSVTFTATVTSGSGTPAGTAQFKVDGANLGTPVTLDGSGVATSPATTSLAVGTRVITAEYSGATTFAPSTGGLDQVVAAAGSATNIAPVTSLAVTGTVGGPAAPAPTVLVTDALANPVPDVSVTFTPSAGTVSGSPVLTGANGQASVTWTLGTAAGTQALEAAAAGLAGSPVIFTATAAAGTASAALTTAVVPGGTAGTPTAIMITVRDANGNKKPGQAGLLAGSVTGVNTATLAAATEQTADTTYATGYTPTAAGTDQVAITLDGTPIGGSPFTTEVSTGAAASVTVVDGDNQIGLLSKTVNVPPAVLVEDSEGNPVPGATVTFTVTGGGGSATGTDAVADAAGIARVGSWTLGPGAGANALQAAITGGDVAVAATGQAAAYDVDVRYFGAELPTTTQQAAFSAAAARWEQLIFGEVADVPMNLAADWCGSVTGLPALAETMDDLVIYAQATPIDGAGGILGQAGPCYVRTTGGLPILGIMQFDAADLDALETGGQLEPVIVHEMGHVVGLGTLWSNPPFTLLANPCPSTGTCTTDPRFTGARGLAAFDAVGGTAYVAGAKVPVEETGGAGTRNGHWRESVFGNELMTGFLNGGSNPLSVVSVGSFWDMGYLVAYADANAFAWSPSPPAFPLGGISVGDDILRVPIGVVSPTGQVERVIRPSP